MAKLIYDGEGAVFGRMGTEVAKKLLKGDSVEIYNAEKVIVSGTLDVISEKIRSKRNMGSGGSLKGPKYIRQEDRLLKRMIRGMLPWDRTKGREAYKRLKCHIGTSELKEGEEMTKFEHKSPMKFVNFKEVVAKLK